MGKGVTPHLQIVTFAGVPAASAAGLATIEIMEKEKVVENCAKMGAYLKGHLEDLKEKHPMIGDLRGTGLLQFIEFVKDRQTKEPFSKEDNLVMKYKVKCYQRGLVGEVYTNIAAGITPPLIVTQSDIDEIVTILDEIIGEMEKEYGIA
jgi:4-aminobutyrate aminotransferase-like enzyme